VFHQLPSFPLSKAPKPGVAITAQPEHSEGTSAPGVGACQTSGERRRMLQSGNSGFVTPRVDCCHLLGGERGELLQVPADRIPPTALSIDLARLGHADPRVAWQGP